MPGGAERIGFGDVAQLADIGAAWGSRLRRIKHIAETIQRGPAADDGGTGSRW